MDVAAFLGHFCSGRHDVVFVVFAVCQHHHGAGSFGVRVETCPAGSDGGADGGALGGHHARAHRFQEELDGGHVCGQRALHIRLPCKDDQPNSVPGGLSHQALHCAGGQGQSGHADIFSHHAVADVQRHHHVDAFGFHFLQPTAHFGVEPTHHQGRQGPTPKQEFPSLTKHPVRGEHRIQSCGIREPTDGLVPPMKVRQGQQRGQDRRHQQRPLFQAVERQARHRGLRGNPRRTQPQPQDGFQKQHQAEHGPQRGMFLWSHALADFKSVDFRTNSNAIDTMANSTQAPLASVLRWYRNTLNCVRSNASISR